MKNAKLSVQVWGAYLLLIGIGLFILPNVVLTTLGFALTTEPWVRVLGAVVIALGYYFWRLSAADVTVFYPFTVHARFAVAAMLTVLVLLNLAPVNLLLFAVLDFLSGLWTFYALRSPTT